MKNKRRFVTKGKDGTTTITIITGLGRLIDLGSQMDATKYRHNSFCGVCGDAESLKSDWYAVGGDLRRALSHQRDEKTKRRTPELTR